jgi:hypothetical protein
VLNIDISKNSCLLKIDDDDMSKEGVCVVPFGIKEIATDAFIKNERLTEVIVSNTVTIIHDHAFEGCINLKKVVMPDSVKYIGNSIFYGCEKLENVKLSKNVPEISGWAFADANACKL